MKYIDIFAAVVLSGMHVSGMCTLPVKAILQNTPVKAVPRTTNESRKRAQLAHIRRIVVIPPFFGTETLNKAAKPGNESKTSPASANDSTPASQSSSSQKDKKETSDKSEGSGISNPNLGQYASYLRKLQEDARKVLPERLTKRGGFAVVPEEEVAVTLKTLQLTPESMFENKGRIKGSKFPLPRAEAIRNISEALHADAVVLGVLDEPRRANGKYFFDPLSGFSYEPGHVEAHGGFYLMLPEGTEALHGYMRVLNPLSKASGRDFILPDWIDAQNLMIENLMDEWTYYTHK